MGNLSQSEGSKEILCEKIHINNNNQFLKADKEKQY
jgi:hypothetical protein